MDEIVAICPPFPTAEPSVSLPKLMMPEVFATTVISSPIADSICPLVWITSAKFPAVTVSVVIPNVFCRSRLTTISPSWPLLP